MQWEEDGVLGIRSWERQGQTGRRDSYNTSIRIGPTERLQARSTRGRIGRQANNNWFRRSGHADSRWWAVLQRFRSPTQGARCNSRRQEWLITRH